MRGAVLEALAAPIGGRPLPDLCRDVLAGRALGRPAAPAVSRRGTALGRRGGSDNTRPVPYRGEGGILWPLVESLLSAGFSPEAITLLVATGTHRVLSDDEIWALVDERARQAGVRVHCHDAADPQSLARWAGRRRGRTSSSTGATWRPTCAYSPGWWSLTSWPASPAAARASVPVW